MQVTNQPPRVAIGVGVRTLTHDMIKESLGFVLNVIDKEDPSCVDKVKHFGFQSGRKVDKFSSYKFAKSNCGAPIILDAVAYYECRVIKEMILELGTHTLFVADVIKAGVKDAGVPYTYTDYRNALKKGGK
jgi:flavin reductase (DIM6/NTAB) family NADH-FMN oxidoreductase RutF